jgi:hypothetical protein
MPINPDLLIAAPMLQDLLVDKLGIPMADGTVTCYQDNSRTTLKNWYYQSGTPGNYTYVTLPNPLTLSAAGTICDINGVDTIPFYYPYSELDESVSQPYFIVIQNQAATYQITRANFPFITQSGSGNSSGTTLNNLITNNAFWRNIQPNYVNITPFTSVNLSSVISLTVAPSQHDGFSMPDVLFVKNNTSATDSLTFTPFPLSNSQVVANTTTPETYINHSCSGAGSSETSKYYQFPIALHVNNLANTPFTFTLQAQNIGGTSAGQNVISVNLLQFTGTGTTSPAVTLVGQLNLTTQWQTYTISSIFPATSGLTLSQAEDDAFYLQLQMPLNETCSINFTKPSLYLTTNLAPANDFQTYDQVNSIISAPRTGDIRVGLSSFYPYGWVPMNDGTIGNPSSNATTYKNSDCWRLFSLLWSLFQPYDSGSNSNPLAQMYTSAGSATNYGASAIADWNANKALMLIRTMGLVMLGTVPLSAMLLATSSGGYKLGISGVSTSGGNLLFTVLGTASMFNGMPIVFSSTGTYPGSIVSNAVYFCTNISATTFQVATTFSNAITSVATGGSSTSFTGTLTAFLQPPGSFEGEYAHDQLLSELVSHNHTGTVAVGTGLQSTTGPGIFVQPTTGPSALSINNTGGGVPFNITQPGAFYNLYMKL